MKNSKVSLVSRIVLVVISALFFISLLFPMWQIELEAPQYPEGLVLKLFSNKIGGDVEIINGLNHYIGMKTLHTEDFIEFQVLSYIMILFGVLFLIAAIVAKRKFVVGMFFGLIAFVMLAGIDFYRWNYEYGHNLDPSAAIQVPGMAYQPPVLGYKQLLNFGAYSIPDTGGWLLIGAGVLLFLVVVKETNFLQKLKRKKQGATIASLFLIGTFMASCDTSKAQEIKINVDGCEHCGMNISSGKFAAELITEKGRCYKFDDLFCMKRYIKDNSSTKFASYFVNDYMQKNTLIDALKAYYVESESLNSPMRGNTAAFLSKEEAQKVASEHSVELTTWDKLKAVE